mmetsp:Transcript_102502/g.311242  ORF Transcript_102502/g.311242 Transcript_102502/m.311242 type:complete len:501 (+) Transcript_102502:44-1546(+)
MQAMQALLPQAGALRLPELLRELVRPRTVALTAAAAALLVAWSRRQRRLAVNHFPEVPLRSTLPLLLAPDKIVETVEKWAKEYGEEGAYEYTLLGERVVVCCSWPVLAEVFAMRPFKVTRPTGYARLGFTQDINGAFFSEGKQWSFHRRLVAPGFNERNVRSYFPAMHMVTKNLLAQLDAAAAAGRPANFTSLMRRLAADVISKVAFSDDLGSLASDSQDLVDVSTLLDAIMQRLLSPVPYWWLPGLARLLDGGDAALARLRRKAIRLLEGQADESTLLAKLAAFEDGKLSRDGLIGSLVELFLAGTETTSYSLTWACYELSQQPELQRQAAAEVTAAAPGGITSGEQLEAMHLVRAVWLETLRCRSVAPFLDLESAEPMVVAGRRQPAGTLFWLLTREATRRSPAVQQTLGRDLDSFRPGRWLGPSGVLECPPFDSLPFGHGARLCLGKNFAHLEGTLVLALLLQRFELLAWEGPAMEERMGFVLMPAKPLELRLRPRT